VLPIAVAVEAAERNEILSRYADHVRRFDEVASRLQSAAEVIPIREPRRQLEQTLTARELEMLQLISEGLTNREIGRRLSLSEETVKVHIRHLFARLQARSRAHAVAIGFRRGIVA
jgi:DNA-binding CsgD family transcriptional regulator